MTAAFTPHQSRMGRGVKFHDPNDTPKTLSQTCASLESLLWFSERMTFTRGIGAELGTGLAELAKNLIGTQNTLEQQAQARRQQELDNTFRQQQATEQTRQFDANFNYRRDSDAYQHLDAQRLDVLKALQSGAFDKDPLMKKRAIELLGQNNKYLKMIEQGKVPSQEDTLAYDAFYQDFAQVSGMGAANLGERTARQAELEQQGQQLRNDAQDAQNTEFRVTSPYRQEVLQVQSKYAEPNAQAGLRLVQNQVALSDAERERVTQTLDGTVSLINAKNDYDTSYVTVQKKLLGLNGATMQAEFLNKLASTGGIGAQVVQGLLDSGDLSPEVADAVTVKAGRVESGEAAQFQILLDQAAITADDRAKSNATLEASIELFNSDADLRIKTNAAAGDLLDLKKEGEKGAYLEGLAKLGAAGQAILDGLKDRGIITTQQAAAFKAKAGNAQRIEVAGVVGAEAAAEANVFSLERAKALFPIELRSAQTALDTANFQLQLAREKKPYDLQILKAQVTALNQEIDQNAALFGPRLAQAKLQVQQLASEVRVLEGTEGARIEAGNLVPQVTQAQLDAQLRENRFADATFGARVQAINLNNQTATQQLLAMKQQYSQNAAKFPAELKYLDAQIAVMQANAKQAAAAALDANGNGVTDRKSMLQALDSMRKINADDRRITSTNLQNTVKRLIPNAKFSVDKYDPKSFTALVATASTLTPDQRAELEQAQLAFEAASSKSSDLSTAIGQVAAKGRVDPKIAERLGIYSPGEADAGGGNYITGPSSPPAKAPKAQNVPAGVVSGKGGVVFSGGGARAVQSLLPQSEITKQIGMTVDHYLGKIKQQGGYSNPWDNTAGPVRAYNGMRPTLDVQLRYVNDIRATYDAQPWVQAMNDATGARRTELQFINSEADRIAKAKGVDPNVIKAIMWNESMGWQPGIPSSDGKGGGLGQVTGYFPPRGSTYSSNTRGGSSAPSGPAAQGGAGASTGPATPATQPKAQPAAAPTSGLILNGKSIPAGGAKLLKDAYTTAMNSKGTPQEKQAKAVQISATLAPMLSQQLGVTVTPQQVFIFLRDNGGRL